MRPLFVIEAFLFMIQIIALNEEDLDKQGIYRIWYGHKYYIGSTINTYDRLLGHEKCVSECFLGIKRGQNSQSNAVDHLNRHTYIYTAYFELLEECESEYELVRREQYYLDKALYDTNCLNYRYTVTRRIDGKQYSMADAFKEECRGNKMIFDFWFDKPNRHWYYPEEVWSRVLMLASYA